MEKELPSTSKEPTQNQSTPPKPNVPETPIDSPNTDEVLHQTLGPYPKGIRKVEPVIPRVDPSVSSPIVKVEESPIVIERLHVKEEIFKLLRDHDLKIEDLYETKRLADSKFLRSYSNNKDTTFGTSETVTHAGRIETVTKEENDQVNTCRIRGLGAIGNAKIINRTGITQFIDSDPI